MSDNRADWESSILQQQDALFGITSFVGGGYQELNMTKYPPQLSITKPQEKEAENAHEFEEGWIAPAPVITRSLEQYMFNPQHNVGPDKAASTIQDVDELPDSYMYPKSETSACGRKRRTTQARQKAGETLSAKRNRQIAGKKQLEKAGPPVERLGSQDDDDAEACILACPFYKKDHQQYHFCLGYHLRRIKDVKQHIYRKHSKPDFYCSRCFEIFDDALSRDAHTRLASCEVRSHARYHGITAEQKKVLAQYARRSMGTHEQWYGMWDTIFPGEQRPKSVHVGSYLEEMVPLMRAFWNKRRLEITSAAVQTMNSKNMAENIMYELMEALFDRLEMETSGVVDNK